MKKSLFSLVVLLSVSSLKSQTTVECVDVSADCTVGSMPSCAQMPSSNNSCPEQTSANACVVLGDIMCDVSGNEKTQITTKSCEAANMSMTEMTSMQICMMQAVNNNDVEMVQKMLTAGVDVNCCDEHGKTPLMCAVDMGHLEMYQYLIQKGADVFMRDHADNSVLFYACSKTRSADMEIDHQKICSHQEIILNLLEMGVDF
jgi:hypothetical protein